jgi:hypothetical protein
MIPDREGSTMPYYGTRRKVFISFHQKDQTEVEDFIDRWAERGGLFIPKVLGVSDNDDIINSQNPEYVMSQIRTRYLGDSTVTMVLVGSCTHSRRYVDWELKASLRQGVNLIPNGVMGIILPSCGANAYLPQRLEENWSKGHQDCYARYWIAPRTADELVEWVEDAHGARTSRAHLIQNGSTMMGYNRRCEICRVTH